MTSKSNYGRMTNNGCSGFLCPPTHPQHSYAVKSSYGDTFLMSLSSAIESTWLNDKCRREAKALLTKWEKPELKSKEIQAWIYQVISYFKNCYTKDTNDRNVNSDNMYIATIDPIENQNNHLGVLFIREYYPEFVLEQRHLNINKE